MAEVARIKKTEGACSCGEPVTRIENCPLSCRADGVRYVYTNRPPDAWNIFRCRGCERVIFDTWAAAKEGDRSADC